MAAVDKEMANISAQKVSLATMQPFSLWDRAGRLTSMKAEMFQLDSQQMVMAPTHEEEITALVSQTISSYRQLPLRIYQIGAKYRNEARPRGGLLRCREFLMKDLYTFDVDEESARSTYQDICNAYHRIFKTLNLPIHMALASSGAIGGSLSHEFHLASPVGQDQIAQCTNCKRCFNSELNHTCCPECQSADSFQTIQGLEVGHTFYLGTKYSTAFDASFNESTGKKRFIEMGCYGIGITRLMAACVEASHDENGIIWPSSIAPFDAYVISNSPEASVFGQEMPSLSSALIDDRTDLSFSRRFKDAMLSGMPMIIVSGSKKTQSGLEVYHRSSDGMVGPNKQLQSS